MTSRKSKETVRRAIAIEAFNELLKQRKEAIEQLQAIEEQEKRIRTKLGKVEEYITLLRPIADEFATLSLDKLPNNILTIIGDMLSPKSIVNLRATSRSMRNSVPISSKTHEEINQEAAEYTRRIDQNLDRSLDDIIQERKAKNLTKQAQQKLNAEHAALLKRNESEVRKSIQLLLQPKIREQRTACKSVQK